MNLTIWMFISFAFLARGETNEDVLYRSCLRLKELGKRKHCPKPKPRTKTPTPPTPKPVPKPQPKARPPEKPRPQSKVSLPPNSIVTISTPRKPVPAPAAPFPREDLSKNPEEFLDHLNELMVKPGSSYTIVYRDIGPKVYSWGGKVARNSTADQPGAYEVESVPENCSNLAERIPDDLCIGYIPEGTEVYIGYPWKEGDNRIFSRGSYEEPFTKQKEKGYAPLGANQRLYRWVEFAYLDNENQCGGKEKRDLAVYLWNTEPAVVAKRETNKERSDVLKREEFFRRLEQKFDALNIPQRCLVRGAGYVPMLNVVDRTKQDAESDLKFDVEEETCTSCNLNASAPITLAKQLHRIVSQSASAGGFKVDAICGKAVDLPHSSVAFENDSCRPKVSCKNDPPSSQILQMMELASFARKIGSYAQGERICRNALHSYQAACGPWGALSKEQRLEQVMNLTQEVARTFQEPLLTPELGRCIIGRESQDLDPNSVNYTICQEDRFDREIEMKRTSISTAFGLMHVTGDLIRGLWANGYLEKYKGQRRPVGTPRTINTYLDLYEAMSNDPKLQIEIGYVALNYEISVARKKGGNSQAILHAAVTGYDKDHQKTYVKGVLDCMSCLKARKDAMKCMIDVTYPERGIKSNKEKKKK